MTRLSVNINKIALIRNARGTNNPDLIQIARQCLDAGCHGITVHPRPDERHIRYDDLPNLAACIAEYPDAEFNIEGYPSKQFMKTVTTIKPDQVTLVPDPPDALTSSFGWDTNVHQSFLNQVINDLHKSSCRVSLFLDPVLKSVEGALALKMDAIELYTYNYAHEYQTDKKEAIEAYIKAITPLKKSGIQINAGHDLNLTNLSYFCQNIPELAEVSIGHALICDALQKGLENTIKAYLECL